VKDSLVEGFLAARERDVAAAVARWSPRMLALALRYATNSDEAHDIVQEAWIRAYRNRRSFRGRGSFSGWLLTICRNVAVSRVRSRTPSGRSADGTPQAVPGPDAEHHDSLRRRAVLDAVLTLPERQRETVTLRLLEGCSTRETAERLGCAEGTVKAALHAALNTLRPQLEDWIP
jgi:RNA polymerase sigma-70 factor (ECF subfamily)